MPSTLYVANLSHTVEREELVRLFAAHGVVRSAEMIDQFKTADSTRAALIEMDTEEHAAAAIVDLNGAHYRGGGPLAVGWANSGEYGPAERAPMFEAMNVPAEAESPELPGEGRRDCIPMRP